MKQIIFLASLMFVVSASSLQAQSWSEWVRLNNTAGVDASVSFKVVSNCSNFSYSFYRTNNETYSERGSLSFSYKYYDCDGVQKTGNGMIMLSKTGIDQSEGYWFLTRGGMIRDIKIEELYMPEKKIWIKRGLNGETIDVWKQKYGN